MGLKDGLRGVAGLTAVLQLAHRAHHFDPLPAQRGVGDRRGQRGQPTDDLGHVRLKLRVGAGRAERADVPAPGPGGDQVDRVPPNLLLNADQHIPRQHQHLQAVLRDARAHLGGAGRRVGPAQAAHPRGGPGQVHRADESGVMVFLLGRIGSIIIFLVDAGLQLLEGGVVDQAVLELHCRVVVVPQQMHDLPLPAALEGRHVLELETQVLLVDLRAALVLLNGDGPLALDGQLAEEVVLMEDVVGPDGDAAQPERPDPAQPPGVGLRDEVRVVKHLSIIWGDMLRVIQASGAGAAGHHQHVLVLVAAVGQVRLDAHVDDLLRRQTRHLAALAARLEEGEDIVVHLHL